MKVDMQVRYFPHQSFLRCYIKQICFYLTDHRHNLECTCISYLGNHRIRKNVFHAS